MHVVILAKQRHSSCVWLPHHLYNMDVGLLGRCSNTLTGLPAELCNGNPLQSPCGCKNDLDASLNEAIFAHWIDIQFVRHAWRIL